MNPKSLTLLFSMLATGLYGCSKQTNKQLQNEQIISDKTGYQLDESKLIAQGFTKVFEDDFESDDLSKWDIWDGGAYNNELQLYGQKNLSVKNGILVIQSKKEKIKGRTLPEDDKIKTFDFSSGRIDSKFTFTPTSATPKIRISARIQIPLGEGMWPAFWSVGDNWPTKGEIDILEAMGKRYTYTTDYFYGKKEKIVDTDGEYTVKEITSPSDLTNAFHVYEVIWEKNSLTFLLDGNVVDEKLSSAQGGEFIPAFYGKLQHVVLNLAVGGDIFGRDFDKSKIQPGSMFIDWIRVYEGK